MNFENIIPYILQYVPKIAGAIIVFILGWIISNAITGFLDRLLRSKNFDETLRPFLVSMVNALLKVLVVISVASMVGIETTSFVAILGAAGLAVGLALQGSLSNFAGGVLTLIFKPFKVGDYIFAQGQEGFVESIQIFTTTLRSHDNRTIILPNGPLANGNIINLSKKGNIRISVSAAIADVKDLKSAREIMLNVARKDSRVLGNPAPEVLVSALRDNGIELVMNVWCDWTNGIPLGFALTENLKIALSDQNIAAPIEKRFIEQV